MNKYMNAIRQEKKRRKEKKQRLAGRKKSRPTEALKLEAWLQQTGKPKGIACSQAQIS